MKIYKLNEIEKSQTIKKTSNEKRSLYLLKSKELLLLKSRRFEDGTTQSRLYKVYLDWNGEILAEECFGIVNDEKGSLIVNHDKAFFKVFTE